MGGAAIKMYSMLSTKKLKQNTAFCFMFLSGPDSPLFYYWLLLLYLNTIWFYEILNITFINISCDVDCICKLLICLVYLFIDATAIVGFLFFFFLHKTSALSLLYLLRKSCSGIFNKKFLKNKRCNCNWWRHFPL